MMLKIKGDAIHDKRKEKNLGLLPVAQRLGMHPVALLTIEANIVHMFEHHVDDILFVLCDNYDERQSLYKKMVINA